MAGGWRTTARMVATAAAARAVVRAAETMRRLAEETAPPEVDRPGSAPEPLQFLESPPHLRAATNPTPMTQPDRIVAAQAEPPHEFGPTPVVTPSRGIGFRSERPVRPTAEMPVISRPAPRDPDEDETASAAPPAPPPPPAPVLTAGSIVEELDDEPDLDDDDELIEDVPEDIEPEPEPEPEVEPSSPVVVEEPFVEMIVAASAEQQTTMETVSLPEPKPQREPKPKREPKPEKKPRQRRKDKSKDKNKKSSPSPDRGKHRRDRGAISGTVVSSRGRGLRGVEVSAIDADDQVVSTTVSGAGGTFVVEHLPAGSFRLCATDGDGDFESGWFGGRSANKARRLKLKDGKTRRKAAISVVSTAAFEVDVDVRKKKVAVVVRVTERGTGIAAAGAVRLSTKQFSTQLALVEGRADITLLGSAKGNKGKRPVARKLQIEYLGDRHTAPGEHTSSLR